MAGFVEMKWLIRVSFAISVVLGLVVFWPEKVEVAAASEASKPERVESRPLPVKARKLVEKIREIENATADEIGGLWELI